MIRKIHDCCKSGLLCVEHLICKLIYVHLCVSTVHINIYCVITLLVRQGTSVKNRWVELYKEIYKEKSERSCSSYSHIVIGTRYMSGFLFLVPSESRVMDPV